MPIMHYMLCGLTQERSLDIQGSLDLGFLSRAGWRRAPSAWSSGWLVEDRSCDEHLGLGV